MKRVCIFCSSSEHWAPVFYSEMELIVKTLVQNQKEVVFGGSQMGLMKHLFDTAMRYKGKVTSVVPTYWMDEALFQGENARVFEVSSLSERKERLIENSDALVAFPGGVGTLDELYTVMTQKYAGEISSPLFVYNFMDYWKPQLDFLTELVERKQLAKPLGELFKVVDSVEELMAQLEKR